ncbi:MAG: mechanosensitive ion channel family protein [Firmicutes bacterium]|nr:mechanosensitive ion channel family protein [Bacillota bacterium]
MKPSSTKSPRPLWSIVGVLLGGIALKLLLNHLPPNIRHHYGDLFKAAIVVMVGGAISYVVERWLARLPHERIGARRATSLRFLARLVLYLAIALALLAAFGVGLSSVVFGSAFVTVILGLAGQSFFSNLIAGIGLVIFHPFEVGDHIQFVAWQYPILTPTFPHEALKPTYSGVVTDINLAYTTLEVEDGTPMMIPNGVLITAAIHNQARRERRLFRFRFDVDMALDPERLLPALEATFREWTYPVDVRLVDMGATTYGLAFLVQAGREPEEVVRHAVLQRVLPIVQALKATPKNDSH